MRRRGHARHRRARAHLDGSMPTLLHAGRDGMRGERSAPNWPARGRACAHARSVCEALSTAVGTQLQLPAARGECAWHACNHSSWAVRGTGAMCRGQRTISSHRAWLRGRLLLLRRVRHARAVNDTIRSMGCRVSGMSGIRGPAALRCSPSHGGAAGPPLTCVQRAHVAQRR